MQNNIKTRYPGDYPDIALTEARKAYESAIKVKEFTLSHASLS